MRDSGQRTAPSSSARAICAQRTEQYRYQPGHDVHASATRAGAVAVAGSRVRRPA